MHYEDCIPGNSNNFVHEGKKYVSPEITVTGPSRFKILLTDKKPEQAPEVLMQQMPTAQPIGARTLDLQPDASVTVEGEDTGNGVMFDAKL